MTIRLEVFGMLVFGALLLYLVFGTKWFADWSRIKVLPVGQQTKAVPPLAMFATVIGLASVTFGLHYLLFGMRTFPMAVTAFFTVFVLMNGLLRNSRAK